MELASAPHDRKPLVVVTRGRQPHAQQQVIDSGEATLVGVGANASTLK
jgi:2,4-dienoyl-CoA reductase-like NADH-dependent reductase (Old Yellow Enzyme family)